MSRTFKDKPRKLRVEPWDKDTQRFQYVAVGKVWGTDEVREYLAYGHIDLPTTKTKKRKAVDTEDHWMTTPNWWVSLTMTKPQRREGALWERKVATSKFENLEELGVPSVSRKPHIYFW